MRAPGTPCSGSLARPSRSCRRSRARSRRAGRARGGARTRPSRSRSTFGGRCGQLVRELAVCRRPGTGSPARAVRPRGSCRARGAGSACRRRAHETARAGCQPGRNSAILGADEATSTWPGARPKRLAEEARRARRCRRRRGRRGRRRCGRSRGRPSRRREPARNRPRSPTSVSCSETSGLNTTGRPRATRLAATTSKCPG